MVIQIMKCLGVLKMAMDYELLFHEVFLTESSYLFSWLFSKADMIL